MIIILYHTKGDFMRLHQYLKDRFYLTKSEVDKFNNAHIKVNGYQKWLSYIIKENDVITYDDKEIDKIHKDIVYILLNKPRGVECTNDRTKENNIRDFINYKDRIYPIGRLDKDSCGLILLSNDGTIFNKILDSKNHVEKEYLVKLDKDYDKSFLEKMSSGVPILGKITKPCKTEYVDSNTFKITLTEGMNRQIRRMTWYFGYKVIYLERIRIGTLNNKLKDGQYIYLDKKDIDNLIKNI
jgi:23S rRNA pseudouridine2604 synthase